MNKFIKVVFIMILGLILISCVTKPDSNNDDNINELIKLQSKHQNAINQLKEENQLLHRKVDGLTNEIKSFKAIDSRQQQAEINKLKVISQNLPDVEQRLVYINKITTNNNKTYFDVDLINWINGEGRDFPNGFKIVNESIENYNYEVAEKNCIYTLTSAGAPKEVILEDFIEKYKKIDYKVPYRLYIIENKVTVVEQQYVP